MIKSGVKYELEALSRRGISFITETYLPAKLKEKDWLA
jgi:DNA topoisomerase-6 subunit A